MLPLLMCCLLYRMITFVFNFFFVAIQFISNDYKNRIEKICILDKQFNTYMNIIDNEWKIQHIKKHAKLL